MAMQLVKEKKDVARINVRVDQSIKDLISKAAYISGQDLTEFTVSTLNEKAREVIEKYERFGLTEAEKKAFFEILDGPIPESTEYSLKEAMKFKQMVKKEQLGV